MIAITIPMQEKFLFDLFMEISDEELILQTTDGRQLMLSSMNGWHGFDVGSSDDFEQEVKATAENQDLVGFLAQRQSTESWVSMADVKKKLGLH